MLRNLLLTVGILLASNLLVLAQTGSLQGKIVDKDTKEPIPFANVAVFSGGDLVTGSTTDYDGKYVIRALTAGNYDVRASFIGYQTLEISGVIVSADQITFQDIELGSTTKTLETVEIQAYKVPLISKDKTISGATVTAEEIEKMPNRSATSIATTVGGVYSDADGGNVSIRGQREDGTVYYIDGIRVSSGARSLPESSIEQVSVLLGGIPARYGDATGGIINVTTKGPSRKFGAGFELQTSEFLDAFGYNRLGFNFQGPLLSKKENNNSKSSVLGYFIAGDVIYRKDGRPSSNGTLNKVTDDWLAYIRETPKRPSGTGFGSFYNAEYTKNDQTESIKSTKNTENLEISLSGKVDLRTSPTVNLTFGGSYNYRDFRNFSYFNSMFNWENNAHYNNNTWRVFGRFTQRFPTNKESTSLIKNVFYSIQADYSRFHQIIEDDSFGDDIFKYGYLGKYDTYKQRSYELGSDTVNGKVYTDVWVQNNWEDTTYLFTPSDNNPILARYTEQYYEFFPNKQGYWQNADQMQLFGGLLNGNTPDPVYNNNLWGAYGTPTNAYQVIDDAQIGISANASADIGNHAFEFGLQYEQRNNRGYGYQRLTSTSNTNLWGIMRLITNAHIIQLDKSSPHLVEIEGAFQDTINYDRLYSEVEQRVFDLNLRKKIGLPLQGTDWIDIDSYDINTQTISYYDPDGTLHQNIPIDGGLSIDMFSPDELINDGTALVYYFGYDPYGNKNSNRPAFADFFTRTEKDDLGRDYRTRDIGAFEPIYMAGYIQDKFAFDDLIFNIGLRVDRFDANQMVLKDPYLFYPAFTADEVSTIGGQAVLHPENISGDAVVYIDNKNNPTEIVGYREESVWYNAKGTEIQDTNILDAGNGITPYLSSPTQTQMTAEVFKDYEPQVSILPRISFSFPISDEALFFAHYDILTQRPSTLLRMNPIQYVHVDKYGSINNPNLKPEKTIDYELGFQQKVSSSSSLKISAFYREIRDQIQYFRYTGAYTGGSNVYDSYSNLDFGTVKGLTVEYDLRRTNNVRARISYTLQFAQGTGSNTTTAQALVNAGLPNLRTIFPLNWDRRHAFNIVLDYRFGEGKNYNGPTSTRKIKGTDKVKTTQWLQNFGVNFTVSGGSGTPYTRSSNITGTYAAGGTRLLEGSINGSRLPWQFRIDARVDKDINISGKPNSTTYFNVYFQVLNLLNTQNIIGVYAATGSPDDDGFLSAPEWQDYISEQLDPEAFSDLYALRMNSPFNFSTPLQLRLGVVFNF
nr:TonB-dependent receptor [Bacteroidota bacterium]